MGEMRLMGGSGRLPVIQEVLLESLGEHAESMLTEGVRPGDTRVTWNPSNSDEVEAAKATFDRLISEKKFVAYKVTGEGSKGTQVKKFDPAAGALILAPPMSGGSDDITARFHNIQRKVEMIVHERLHAGEDPYQFTPLLVDRLTTEEVRDLAAMKVMEIAIRLRDAH